MSTDSKAKFDKNGLCSYCPYCDCTDLDIAMRKRELQLRSKADGLTKPIKPILNTRAPDYTEERTV